MRVRKLRTPLPENKYLTPDLWSEVLLRSPPKTLLRFSLVLHKVYEGESETSSSLVLKGQ
ncbi:hypothetical protein SOVF_035760 [Spinacia oleracea]|nr:hypothetical protein SOVF_035760 [Spinacia oleracea]